VPARLWNPALQDHVNNRERVPKHNYLDEGMQRDINRRQVPRSDDDPYQEGNGQEPDAPQPWKPFARTGRGFHFRFFTVLAARLALCQAQRARSMSQRTRLRAPPLDEAPAIGRLSQDYLPASLPINENKGRYIETTMPPTTTPRTTIINGSMAVKRSFTAASTSSS